MTRAEEVARVAEVIRRQLAGGKWHHAVGLGGWGHDIGLHGAGSEWACWWEGWDKIQIVGPGVDLLLIVPDCTELTLWWSRDDLPGLAPEPEQEPLVPWTVTPRFGEQLTLGMAA